MAGKPGMKGGGGARPGAGRKPKPRNDSVKVELELEPQPHGGALKRSREAPAPIQDRDMLQLLQDVALGRVDASSLQVRAAIAAVQYTHTKRGDGGIKEGLASAATAASKGRFAPVAPPLKLVGRK